MQTKLYALDSSFIIKFLKGDEKAKEVYEDVKSGEFIVPAPTLMETLRGVDNIGQFRQLDCEDFGEDEVEEEVNIIEHLEQKGEMIGILDVIIASIALENNAEIVTYDRDYDKLKEYGLNIVKPS
jgi:predicted nucleic acid-binding protein